MIGKYFRRLFVRYAVWRGKAVDIWSKSDYPADVLNNLYNNGFSFDGVEGGSMEGFLQSLKYESSERQRQICSMTGKYAKAMTVSDWQKDQIVWWQGCPIDRQSGDYMALVRKAYDAMFCQNATFRSALMSTRGQNLYHCRGEQDPYKTILTEKEFCGTLTALRDSYAGVDK